MKIFYFNFSSSNSSLATKEKLLVLNQKINNEKDSNTFKEKINEKSEKQTLNIEAKKENNFRIIISQREEEIQEMDFEEAMNQDDRTYLRIYWGFLVDSQIILGTFFTENYLDLFII